MRFEPAYVLPSGLLTDEDLAIINGLKHVSFMAWLAEGGDQHDAQIMRAIAHTRTLCGNGVRLSVEVVATLAEADRWGALAEVALHRGIETTDRAPNTCPCAYCLGD